MNNINISPNVQSKLFNDKGLVFLQEKSKCIVSIFTKVTGYQSKILAYQTIRYI